MTTTTPATNIERGFRRAVQKIKSVRDSLALKIDTAKIGVANGVVPLGADGKIATAYIPDALLGTMTFQTAWNAATNTPAIPAASAANKGWYYIVETAGTTTVSGISSWSSGDWLVSAGTKWVKIDNTEVVTSVCGKIGAIVLTAADVGADAAGSSVTALASAKTYADTVAANALTSAKTYSDGKLSTSVASLQAKIDAIPAATTVSSAVANIVCVMTAYAYEASFRFDFYDSYGATGNVLGSASVYMAANGTYTTAVSIPAGWKSCRVKNNWAWYGTPPSAVYLRNSLGQDILASAITNVSGNASAQIVGNMPTGKYAVTFA